MKIFKRLNLFIILFLLNAYIYGQIKENVEVVPVISPQPIAKNCRDLRLGKVIFFLVPDYPPEAKTVGVGGTVTVNIKLDEKGSMTEIGKVSGHKLLRAAATDAARKVKFTPTVCDQAPVNLLVVMNYNFILYLENDNYSSAVKIEDFRDVSEDSEFYEAILDLTENYRIAFGYADKNFYADAPLTRGDFAHFLRLSLDLLSERAKIAGKIPRRIGLFSPHNPQNLKGANDIKKLDKKEPFADSVKLLLLNYEIALVGEKKEFSGKSPISQNEVIEIWTKIFGADAVPVNFKPETGGRIMTRGEFALFLQESFGVLTYKVLP